MECAQITEQQQCQDAHRDIQKHNATHHRGHFSSTTVPVCEINPKNQRTICHFHLIPIIFSPLLFTESSLFLLFPALYPHHSECKSLPAAFSPQLTSLSFSLSHPSSYSLPSLSCLISSPTPLHSFLRYFSFFSTI